MQLKNVGELRKFLIKSDLTLFYLKSNSWNNAGRTYRMWQNISLQSYSRGHVFNR
jgi:hypothetical protein